MTLMAACIQLNVGPVIEDNISQASDLIRGAADKGARFISTPENTCHIRSPQSEKLNSAMSEDAHIALPVFSELARELNVSLLIGSMSIKLDSDLIANRSYLFNENGEITARYDKIHLFDVDLPTGESHRESDLMRAGTQAVLADIPEARLGLSICYDVRFAYLYRDLAKAGAQILTVPAAFTVPTGVAHWETLLRARAIETGSFVIAPAQCGTHEGERKTYGHSLIINPWGTVLAEAGEEPGFILAELDLDEVDKARSSIPALKNERSYQAA